MFDVANQVGAKIPRRLMSAVVDAFQRRLPAGRRGAVSVALVDRRTSRRLNRSYRGVDAPTDVLSFPGHRPPVWPKDGNRMLGEIVICYPVAQRQAQEYGHSVRQEIAELLAHGLAHLAGFDHDTKAKARRMAEFETKIITAVQRQTNS